MTLTSDEEWARTARIDLPERKRQVTLRLDPDLLAWFKRAPGWQTRINAILRSYYEVHREQ